MKHSVSDVVREIEQLEELYPDEFYDGEANQHIMQYVDEYSRFEYWHDYIFLFLAAGLEWAVIQKLGGDIENISEKS